MACTGKEWCDFVSYDPRLPEHLRLFVKRIDRDAQYINLLEHEIIVFNGEIQEKLSKLKALGGQL